MSAVFYLLGLLLGAAAFFYILSLYHSGADALAARKKEKQDGKIELDPSIMEIISRQAYPRERICPLCKAVLTGDDVLYATRVEKPLGPKILIHGCRFCYRPPGNEQEKKNTE